jgi:hypothetical protein
MFDGGQVLSLESHTASHLSQVLMKTAFEHLPPWRLGRKNQLREAVFSEQGVPLYVNIASILPFNPFGHAKFWKRVKAIVARRIEVEKRHSVSALRIETLGESPDVFRRYL